MFRRSIRSAMVALASTALVAGTAAAYAEPVTELPPSAVKVTPLKDAAMIVTTQYGYRYVSGQQNGHLVITEVDGDLLYTDTGTQQLRDIPSTCRQVKVSRGIAARCSVPAKYSGPNSMYLEVWPRLGDDYTDGRALPAKYRMWVLADKGDDITFGGAGDDFVNGAQDDDEVHGGAGNDWLRTGLGDDKIWGDDGNDRVVGVYGRDVVHGGNGNDRVGGGPDADQLYGDAGADVLVCGTGADSAWTDSSDRVIGCERTGGS